MVTVAIAAIAIAIVVVVGVNVCVEAGKLCHARGHVVDDGLDVEDWRAGGDHGLEEAGHVAGRGAALVGLFGGGGVGCVRAGSARRVGERGREGAAARRLGRRLQRSVRLRLRVLLWLRWLFAVLFVGWFLFGGLLWVEGCRRGAVGAWVEWGAVGRVGGGGGGAEMGNCYLKK